MTRVLLALLAMLTGLATCGSPVLANMQAQSGTTACASQQESEPGRIATVARSMAVRSMPMATIADGGMHAPLYAVPPVSSVWLQVDRAHE